MSDLSNAKQTAEAYRIEIIRIMKKHPDARCSLDLGEDKVDYMAASAQHAHWYAIAKLQEKNARLEAQVERLIKAGDAVYQVLDFRRHDPELTSMVGKQWFDAKEGKR